MTIRHWKYAILNIGHRRKNHQILLENERKQDEEDGDADGDGNGDGETEEEGETGTTDEVGWEKTNNNLRSILKE